MPAPSESLEETLRRLRDEREDADRRYNDALTALDAALPPPPDVPRPPAAYDETQITPLNRAWDIGAERPAAGGLKGRLAALVWAIVGPMLQRQKTFNSLLVDHLNRNVAAHREAERALAETLAVLRTEMAGLAAFRSHLIRYLQQITAYVDTKDREAAGGALVVNAAVNALAEELAKRWESMAVREQRAAAKVAALTGAHDELRTVVEVTQQAALATRRELARATTIAPGPRPVDVGPQASAAAFAAPLDAYKYVGFENEFRGSQATIRARLESYLPFFDGASDVLDVGCGRGEFLDLLQARGVTARGLDLNHEMVEVCRARGLEVAEADVVSYLDAQPAGALGGLFAAQVVEHLQPAYLLRFLELAAEKLRPGAPIVLETLNPACWTAFFDSFIRDITHVWPLHPETLRYLVLASGFTGARVEYRSPVAPHDRLQTVPAAAGGSAADFAETFNANVEKLNARMFTFLDYAIVGAR